MLRRSAIASTLLLLVTSAAPVIVDHSLTPLSAYAIIVLAPCLYLLAELQWCCRCPLPDGALLNHTGTTNPARRCARPYDDAAAVIKPRDAQIFPCACTRMRAALVLASAARWLVMSLAIGQAEPENSAATSGSSAQQRF